MRRRVGVCMPFGTVLLSLFILMADPLRADDQRSSLHSYAPSNQEGSSLSSLVPHCTDCRALVPGKPNVRSGSRSFHRPPRHQGSTYKKLGKLKNGAHLKLKATGHRARRRMTQLPPRAMTRLGLTARYFEGWQLQAVDGDTIRYGTQRIRVRGLNAPELSEAGGLEAQHRLAHLLSEGSIRIIPHGQDVYGRLLADVFVHDRNVADVMTAEGYAGRR